MFVRSLILSVFAVLFIAPKAQAQWLFSPTFTYESSEVKPDSGAATKQTFTAIHARVGYILSNRFYVGGIYEQETWNSGGTFSPKITGFGPSVGYVSEKGFNVILHYLYGAQYEQSTTFKRTAGAGPQIDVGYSFELNSTFALGPQITYRSVTFSKSETNGVENDDDKITYTDLRPMIALFVKF